MWYDYYLVEHFGKVRLSIDVIPTEAVWQFVFVKVAENRKNKCMSMIFIFRERWCIENTSKELTYGAKGF